MLTSYGCILKHLCYCMQQTLHLLKQFNSYDLPVVIVLHNPYVNDRIILGHRMS